MPFDNSLILRDGTVDLAVAEATAPPTLLTADAYGAKCLDLKETAVKGLAAVMVVPSVHATLATEPITYADTLDVSIQVSDHLARNWETLTSFPLLHALMRKIKLSSTIAFIDGDIGETIIKATSLDAGVILEIDQALLTAGGIGYILLSMIDLNDLFTLDANTVLDCTGSGGTGTGVLLASGEAVSTCGVFVVRFATDKRYARAFCTTGASGHFYGTQIMLSPYPFKRL